MPHFVLMEFNGRVDIDPKLRCSYRCALYTVPPIAGIDQVYLNGVADWLYEEEILSTELAMWSSSDGRYLAYITFNESSVDYFSWVEYGDPGNDYVKVCD